MSRGLHMSAVAECGDATLPLDKKQLINLQNWTQLYYILNKILNTKFPPCKYKIPPWWGISPRLRTHVVDYSFLLSSIYDSRQFVFTF